MEQKYKFSQVKKYLTEQPQIRFKGLATPKEKNPVDFLENFFVYNSSFITVYEKNMEQQESHGKRRSIGDIYRIVNTYFPRLTLTTTYKTLLRMVGEGKVLSSICQATGLRVYRATKTGEKAYFNGAKTDEFTTDLTQFEEIDGCKSISGNWGYDYSEKHINFVEI